MMSEVVSKLLIRLSLDQRTLHARCQSTPWSLVPEARSHFCKVSSSSYRSQSSRADEQLLTGPHPADIELRIPATISGPKRTETARGSLYVTDKRVSFRLSPICRTS